MSAELSITLSVSTVLGGTLSALRTVLGGTRDLRPSIRLVRQEYNSLGREISRMTGSASHDLANLRRQHQALGDIARRMRINQIRQNYAQTRLSLNREARARMKDEVFGVVAGLGVVAIPVKLAIEFESAMADVKKVVDFDTPQQFQQMNRDILKLTRTIPMAGKDIAAIVAAGGQSGVARKDLLGFASDAAKMGVAFDMAAGDAGEAMATLSNVLQIPIPKISRLGDAINHLSDNANSKAADIVNVLTRVGSDTKQLGLTENQAAALGSTFLSMGKAPELAAQAMKGMVTSLSVMKTGDAKDQLAKLGLTTKQFADAMNKDANAAILNLLERVKQLPKDEQFPLLLDLFGKNYADDALLLANNVGEYRRQLDLLAETDAGGKLKYLGSMQREFENRSATTANQMQLLKNGLAEFGISIGSVILPVVNDLLKSLRPLIEDFVRFAQAHPKLIKNIFLVIAAMAGFKAGSLAVRFGLNGLSSAFFGIRSYGLGLSASLLRVNAALRLFRAGRAVSALRLLGLSARQARAALAVFGRVSGGLRAAFGGIRAIGTSIVGLFARLRGAGSVMVWLQRLWSGLGAVFSASPIGWVVLAVALAALLIYKYWGPIKSYFIGVWKGFQAAMAPVMPLLKQLWEAFAALFEPLIQWFGEFTGSTAGASAEAENFGVTVGTVIGGILAAVIETGAMIINGWRMIFDTLFGAADAAWTEIKTAFDGGLTGILGLILNWSPLGAFYQAFAAVMSWFGVELPAKFTEFGQMLLDGLINGIKSKVDAVVGTVTSLANRIKSAFTGPVAIHSPSRVFKSYGGYLMEGLQLGIGAAAGRPLAAVQSVAGRLKQRFTSGSGLSAEMAASIRTNADEFAAARQNQAAGGGITVHFNPTINAPGSDAQQIQTALRLGLREFEQMFDRLMADRARRAF